jgi:hypothetical protein
MPPYRVTMFGVMNSSSMYTATAPVVKTEAKPYRAHVRVLPLV